MAPLFLSRYRPRGYKPLIKYERKACPVNLHEYLEHELRTFDELPLGPVDSAALSQLAMVEASGIVPALRPRDVERLRRVGGIDAAGATMPGEEDSFLPRLVDRADALADALNARLVRGAHVADLLAAERFDTMFTGLDQVNIKREIGALAASPRFRVLELRDYVSLLDDAKRVQFSATCYVLPGRWAYVAFRGTDTSFTGWRENFDMAVTPPVPAQRMAAAYLELVARHLPQDLYVGGHSKGGNLATYAALRCSDAVRARITAVFDHDGPGFKPGFLEDESALRARSQLAGKMERTVPVDSVVGMLMDSVASESAVLSSALGADQHSVFTWQVEDGAFACAPQVSSIARRTHEVMGSWLASFAPDELPGFIDELFGALESSGADNAGQIFGGGPQAAQLIREATRNADDRAREVIAPAIARLAAISAAGIARDAAAGIAQGLSSIFQRQQTS